MITPYTLDEWKKVPATNEVAKTLRQVRAQIDEVLIGNRLAVIVFGGSGLGKNHLVAEALARHGVEAVEAQPKSFLETLGAFHEATHGRKTPKAVVFDEAQLIFETEKNLNVMKAATDTGVHATRYRHDYVWFTEEVDEEGKTRRVRRTGTSLKAPIICMTNRNLDDLGKHREHADALFNSRVQPISLTNDPLAVWEYVVWLALDSGLLSQAPTGVPLATRARVLDWFTDNLWNLKQVSVRTLQNALREFVNPNGEFLKENLNLMLKPKAERVERYTPQLSDWTALRSAW